MVKRVMLICLVVGSWAQAAELKQEETQSVREGSQAEPWGLLSSIDLKGCDPAIIRDAEKIREYVIELCDLIEMKRFGECQVVHFGEDEKVAGYSMVQLIETSLISGHFANLTNAAYIDVFSCKTYDPEIVAEFSKEFFKAENCSVHSLVRD